ncbi:MAG TPA: 4'-phosphopantetheinyl transferase superfamily protein [Clostridium sp.]|jgi:4'-phosphopantetheinyl transferase|nr:4'-phosphopantetheinyl transferase superfamily protein [Clostridium sp.]
MSEIYATEIKSPVNKKLFEKALNYIPENKQKRIKRFLKYEDSLKTLIAEVLIRKIIMLKLKINNDEIIFKTNEFGKPYLKDHDEFHFNISHSGKWIVCVVSDKPVGIDVEKIKDLDIKIADRFFSKEEVEDLYKTKESERLKYFFELWTLKESYIKADGRGFNIPLNSFSFKIKDDEIVFNTQNNLKNCFFKRYKIDPNYKLSVCSLTPKFPKTIQMDEGEILLSEFLSLCEREAKI